MIRFKVDIGNHLPITDLSCMKIIGHDDKNTFDCVFAINHNTRDMAKFIEIALNSIMEKLENQGEK